MADVSAPYGPQLPSGALELVQTAPEASCSVLAFTDWLHSVARLVERNQVDAMQALLAVTFATERRERIAADQRVEAAIERMWGAKAELARRTP